MTWTPDEQDGASPAVPCPAGGPGVRGWLPSAALVPVAVVVLVLATAGGAAGSGRRVALQLVSAALFLVAGVLALRGPGRPERGPEVPAADRRTGADRRAAGETSSGADVPAPPGLFDRATGPALDVPHPLREPGVLDPSDEDAGSPVAAVLGAGGLAEHGSPLVAAARRNSQLVAVLAVGIDTEPVSMFEPPLRQLPDPRPGARSGTPPDPVTTARESAGRSGDESAAASSLVAGQVRSVCREHDLVVSLRPGELFVVLQASRPDEVPACADRIRAAVREASAVGAAPAPGEAPSARDMPSGNGSGPVTVCVGGVISSPPHLLPGDEALRWLRQLAAEADVRLREAQAAGPDRTVLGTPRRSAVG